jgi:quercetin dioxygenase-like cupin family protein
VSVVNLFEVELTKDEDDAPGYELSYARVGPLVDGEQLGLSVYELVPGQSICPYHYENAEEEWLIVLVGRPTLRTPDGERELERWDCAFFPTGEAGAHKVTNRTDETVRVWVAVFMVGSSRGLGLSGLGEGRRVASRQAVPSGRRGRLLQRRSLGIGTRLAPRPAEQEEAAGQAQAPMTAQNVLLVIDEP